MGVHTGMRREEICRLEWSHLDHSPGFIRIGEESKTSRVRYIPINSVVKTVLDSQKRWFGDKGPVGHVFVNGRRRNAYRKGSVSHSFKRAVKATAAHLRDLDRTEEADRIEKACFHTLRHSFASWLIQAGIPIAKVQQYLGHAGDHMTRRYAHLAPANDGDRKALEILTKVGTNPAPRGCVPEESVVTS